MAALALVPMVGSALIGAALLGLHGRAAAQGPTSGDLPLADIIVLIDESGSLTNEAVDRERDAARLVVQSVLARGSLVAVVGFGSSNAPGQNAVEVYCPLHPVRTTSDQAILNACIDRVHRRIAAEGNDTDHAAALETAIGLLRVRLQGQNPGRPIVLLLTDGKLDVSRSPQYGATAAARNLAAQRKIEVLLTEAARLGVQVWPLGFGEADPDQLGGFVSGPVELADCEGTTTLQPSATVVSTPPEVLNIVYDALASATCANSDVRPPEPIGTGESVEQRIVIPSLATDATLTMIKGSDRISTTVISPSGVAVPESGAVEGQLFEWIGRGQAIESLRITDPIPGEWTVRFESSAPTSELVGARVLWTGALSALIDIEPNQPTQGSEVVVEVVLRTRRDLILDPAALAGVRVSGRVRLDESSFAVDLRDDGMGRDQSAFDGVYTGVVPIPGDFIGDGEIVASVQGRGLQPDRRPIGFRVDPTVPLFLVRIEIGAQESPLSPGSTIPGTVSVINEGSEQVVRLGIIDASPGVEISVDPSEFLIPSGATSLAFAVRIGEALVEGPTFVQLQVRSAADSAIRDRELIQFEVSIPSPPRPFSDRIRGALPAIIVALLVGAFVVRRLVVSRRVAVFPAVVELVSDTGEVLQLIRAVRTDRHLMRFALESTDDGWKLDRKVGRSGAIVVRRVPKGFKVIGPSSEWLLVSGGTCQPYEGGPTIRVSDLRVSRRGRLGKAGAGNTARRRRTVPQQSRGASSAWNGPRREDYDELT